MAIDYATVKTIHVGSVALSFALFAQRGAWRFTAPELLARAWVRVVPHVVDTVLLLSALVLAWLWPKDAPHGWIAAKIAGLVVYIALGTIALKRGRTDGIRLAAFVAGIAVFGYVVSVALTKSPLGFINWIA